MILSFDTALGGMSVCVSREGEPVAGFADPTLTDQAALLLPTIERVMAEAGVGYADLEGIAVTIGPGGFTGVRIGLATARALAFAANKPLLGFTTLELIAEAHPTRPLIAALPAGRGLFYVQHFTATGEASEPAMRSEAETFALAEGCVFACPPGAWLERLPRHVVHRPHDIAANAILLARLARRRGFGADLPEAIPLYLRPPDAKPQASLLAGRASA